MTDNGLDQFTKLIKAISALIDNITNVTGVVKKNVDAYWKIKDDYAARRQRDRLEHLLLSISDWHLRQGRTLMRLGHMLAESNDKSKIDDDAFRGYDTRWGYELQEFRGRVLQTLDLLMQYHSDLVKVDYKLFEDLRVNLEGRAQLLLTLKDTQEKTMVRDRLVELYEGYTLLVSSLADLKAALAAAAKGKRPPAIRKSQTRSNRGRRK